MEKFVINGGKKLEGSVKVSGAKNVALKALVAACLTEEEVVIENIPLITDVFVMTEIIKELGGSVTILDHRVKVKMQRFQTTRIALERAAEVRTSAMFLSPLLAREKKAIIPNPGGCRLGARPIDRLVEGLRMLNAKINYRSEDGYFHADTEGLVGAEYMFKKTTHTGTETLILAAVLAKGKTILKNSALEPEIDELIDILNKMGGKVKRTTDSRTIEIEGVSKLHGARFSIGPDRNEIVTFAIAAIATKGDIFIEGAENSQIKDFLQKLKEAGGGIEEKSDGIRFYYKGELSSVSVSTSPYPGFMTDWQPLWAVLMTQAMGQSIIHETVFENKLDYINDLQKMGADANLFNPKIDNPEKIYNFNLNDDSPEYFHAVKIKGPIRLHNAILTMRNIRAGAAVVVAALVAHGQSVILEIEHLDRGYEVLEKRLKTLGAEIKRINL